MTIAELIAELQSLPSDLPVYLGDWNEEYSPDVPLDAVFLLKEEPRRDLPKRVRLGRGA